MKTSARAGFLLALVCVSALSCEEHPDIISIERSWATASAGIPVSRDTVETVKEALWWSAVEYPGGYDWIQDSLFGNVNCTIHLMRDSVCVLDIPAGKARGISPDADSHFLFEGHLYTTFPSSGTMSVRRDGDLLFSYHCSGERLVGMVPAGGSVLTLSLSSDALILRRDGRTVWEKDGAVPERDFEESALDPFGALYLDNGKPCFSYSKGGETFAVRGDETVKADGQWKLSDIASTRFICGNLYVLGHDTDLGVPRILSPDAGIDLLYYDADTDSRLRLGRSGDIMYFTSTYGKGSVDVTEIVVQQGLLRRVEAERCLMLQVGGGLSWILWSGGGMLVHRKEGADTGLEGWRLPSSRCCIMTDSGAVLALAPSHRKGKAALWKDGSFEELGMNGYVSCLEFY